MTAYEWSRLWNDEQLDLEFYQAVCIKDGFPVHMHEYFVICFIESGLQSFRHRRTKHLTPPGGLILLNPGDDHTGEPVDKNGFEYRALYPTEKHMKKVVLDLTEKDNSMPIFSKLRVDDPGIAKAVKELHISLINETSPIEREYNFLSVLAKLISDYTEIRPKVFKIAREKSVVKKVSDYIHDNISEKITLTELSEYAGLSRYYLLRIFRNETGMPPHSYLESLRISKAKKLIETNLPLVQVAMELGFSDQSHFSNSFKRFTGITPRQYLNAVHPVKHQNQNFRYSYDHYPDNPMNV